MKRLLLSAVLVLAGCGSISDMYVDSDRKTYEAVWPEYQEYFLADPKLDKEQKERRLRTGKAWAARVTEGASE